MILKYLLITLLIILSISTHSETSKIHIISNQSVDISKLDRNQIKRIFTMYQNSWPSGRPIVVFVLASQHQNHQLFCREILGLFPYQLDRIWNKLIYSGLGEGPIRVQSESEMLERVAQQPGAIGYLVALKPTDNVNTLQLSEGH